MSNQRLKGQEVSIIIAQDSVVLVELTDIMNFNSGLKFEQIEQAYLGEKTARHDEVFKGSKGDFEMHTHSRDWLNLVQAIKDRAQRKTPDTVFNISAVLFYPNGQTPTILWPDVKFGEIPISIGGMAEYKKVKIDYVADDFSIDLG